MISKHSVKWIAAGLGLCMVCSSIAHADNASVSKDDYSVIARLADQSLLLGGEVVGDKMVVVGSRGHILLSKDDGNSWTQARVPTRVALTAVHFSDDSNGWAVGHDAIILNTKDGGSTWERVHYAPEEERPLLDIWFDASGQTGFAYGAYGFVLKSNDGGANWRSLDIGAEDGEPDDYHLNAIAKAKNGVMYLAAEAGVAYRSFDDGETWERMYAPYEGSFFGVLPLSGDSLLMFGLQGNVFRSDDLGESWTPIEIELTATLNGGAVLNDGTVVIVGNEGAMLVSSSGGYSFVEKNLEDRKSISNIIPTKDNGALLVGDMGVRKLSHSDLN